MCELDPNLGQISARDRIVVSDWIGSRLDYNNYNRLRAIHPNHNNNNNNSYDYGALVVQRLLLLLQIQIQIQILYLQIHSSQSSYVHIQFL